jgi:hypothetical protein
MVEIVVGVASSTSSSSRGDVLVGDDVLVCIMESLSRFRVWYFVNERYLKL